MRSSWVLLGAGLALSPLLTGVARALSASQNGLIIVNAGATLDFSNPRTDQAPPIAYLQTGWP
jgi:hypothetical protein